MSRTARALMPLAASTRATSVSALATVDAAFTNLADGAARVSPVRFVGYATPSERQQLAGNVSGDLADHRVAVYEADYA